MHYSNEDLAARIIQDEVRFRQYYARLERLEWERFMDIQKTNALYGGVQALAKAGGFPGNMYQPPPNPILPKP